jgi:hypothetical protein
VNNRAKIELVVDLAVAGVLIVYILSLNPTSYIYLRNYARAVRWWLWCYSNPEWLKEALHVRGYL